MPQQRDAPLQVPLVSIMFLCQGYFRFKFQTTLFSQFSNQVIHFISLGLNFEKHKALLWVHALFWIIPYPLGPTTTKAEEWAAQTARVGYVLRNTGFIYETFF